MHDDDSDGNAAPDLEWHLDVAPFVLAPFVADLRITEPDLLGAPELVVSDDWEPVDHERLHAHAGHPIAATFTDHDLSPAYAALPVEFTEDFWAVEP